MTGDCMEPDTSRPITTGPGNAGTLPQAISAALCRAALIVCGTSWPAFKYAARYWYGNCRDPYAQGTNDPREELHPNEDGLSALGFAALSGHFEVFDYKGLRLDVKHPGLKEMMSDAYKPGGEKVLKRLLAMGMEPNDQENGGCSAIESLLAHMHWTRGRRPGREPERGNIDTGKARQKMKIIHILARHGAKWIPKDKREVKRARRSLLKLKPDYTVEYVWIMSRYKACTLDIVQELLCPSSIRSHISGRSQRVQELLAPWS